MEERIMTIAKGLGRIKTIKGQLESIKCDLQMYSAWNSKLKCNLGISGNDSSKLSAAETINAAQEKVNSLYQQYGDLLVELAKIKMAIDKTNAVTNITIAGKTMTIHEALTYKKEVLKYYEDATKMIVSCFTRVERDVDTYNARLLNNINLSEADKKVLQADTMYLVSRNKIEELRKWNNEFISEINNELNAINAVTNIIF